MRKTLLLLAALSMASFHLAVSAAELHTFKRVQLDNHFWGEGASFGDFNKDGHMDIVSGPYWYEGPDFKTRHEFYPATMTFKRVNGEGKEEVIPGFEGAMGTNNTYSDNFFNFVYDFNGDGWPDVMVYGFPGKDAAWYENPKGRDGHWQKHIVFEVVDNESPGFVDINGDGKPDILCCNGGYFGYATADWKNPGAPWKFHPVSAKGNWQKFTHGIGSGDINGDGRVDILDKDGWWEQPASLQGDPEWKRHLYSFGGGMGGAQMIVYDVNGDGLNDVITSVAAHGYGLAWYEQVRDKGEITFKEHIILNKDNTPNNYGVTFAQLHALALADIDGDGVMDVVTGKRFWAHGMHGDPEPNAPPVVYWFQIVRDSKHQVKFVPHLADNDSGVGTQVTVGNVTDKKHPDIIVGNKKGTFILEHQVKKVSESEWKKAQPVPVTASLSK